MKRQNPEDEGSNKEDESERAGGEKTGAEIEAEIAKAIKSVQTKNVKSKNNTTDNNEGISLFGLLNAIDDVASHEGRVLVMTTNFSDKLDEALIRPKRIDMRINFTLVTRYQICELFTRMYSPDRQTKSTAQPVTADMEFVTTNVNPNHLHHRKTSKISSSSSDSTTASAKLVNRADLTTPPHTPRSGTPAYGEGSAKGDNIAFIAAQFAERIPESVFSPAEIQGFLLTRKKKPRRALWEVEAWRNKLLEAKAEKSKTS